MDGPELSWSVGVDTPVAPQTKGIRASCDLCRRMKIKCERQGKNCKHCAARNLECTVTARERRKRLVKRTDYIATIEDRIRRMEVVINAAGLVAEPSEPESVVDEIEGQAGLSDRMSTLMMGEEGMYQFIGASSAFSLFSPRGLQWTKDNSRGHDTDRLFRAIANGHRPWMDFTTHLWRSRPDAEQTPLPTKDLADEYINAYFHLFNPVFPIYQETHFRGLYERQYALNPPMGVAWCASLNIVLAMGSAILYKNCVDGKHCPMIEFDFTQGLSWMYFRNASSKFTDLLFKNGEIMAIQAILCMAFMLQAIPDPQPAYVLTAAAVRLSHTIGLHRSLDEFGLDAAEKKLRQNLFWITYVMEVGMSSKCGRPPAMSDQDIAVALPQTTSTGLDHLRCVAMLSLLESRVYSELYSAKAATRPGLERLKSISKLDTELTRWRDALPVGYRPESEIACLEHEYTAVVMMHFNYYNCLGAIHRASVHHGSWTSASDRSSGLEDGDGDDDVLNPRVYESSSLCLEAARKIVGLLKHYNGDFPQDNLILMVLYYPLTATLTLFANILKDPQSTDAFSDIDLMGVVTAFLDRLIQFQQHLGGLVKIFAELNHIAGLIVRDAQMTRLSELKRRVSGAANIDDEDVSSTASPGQPAQYFVSPDGGSDAIPPATSYTYADLDPFDQSQMFATDEFSLGFPYELVETWTGQNPENVAEMRKKW